MTTLCREPGTYVLAIRVHESRDVHIGALGTANLARGWHLYVGSALGPGGLGARVQRHLSSPDRKKPHWHIDYLLGVGNVREVWSVTNAHRIECEVADTLSAIGIIHLPGFGASDCKCPGHLIYFDSFEILDGGYSMLEKLYGFLQYAVIK